MPRIPGRSGIRLAVLSREAPGCGRARRLSLALHAQSSPAPNVLWRWGHPGPKGFTNVEKSPSYADRRDPRGGLLECTEPTRTRIRLSRLYVTSTVRASETCSR